MFVKRKGLGKPPARRFPGREGEAILGVVGELQFDVVKHRLSAEYGVDPQRVVLMGSSSGGQLSMLAGFAPYHPDMTPPEVKDADLYVRAVVSLYGPSDLAACYFHIHQDKTTGHLTYPPALAPANPEMAARMRREWLTDGFVIKLRDLGMVIESPG